MPDDDTLLRYSSQAKRSGAKARDRGPMDRPLFQEELIDQLEPRDPIGKAKEPVIQFDLHVAAGGDLEVDVDRSVANGAVLSGRFRDELEEARPWQVRVSVKNPAIGVHVYPPRAELVEIEHDEQDAGDGHVEFEGFLPDHLPLRLTPRKLPRELRVARRYVADALARRELLRGPDVATTIFGGDDRYTFNDTSYPWCTVGRIDTPGGQASGTMVGPRHVLTCNHAIQWNADNTAGWVKFTPAYFDGSAPFGIAWGTRVYWEGQKVYGPGLDRDEEQHDYVCVVLDWPIGNLTGWMGSRSWSDDWDDLAVWRHIGYPGDLAAGQRPSYQGGISLDGSFWDREVHTRIYHHADVWPGQSGGPFFAWWAGESFPRVVADQSAQNSDDNIASGGAHMVNCIIRARNDYP